MGVLSPLMLTQTDALWLLLEARASRDVIRDTLAKAVRNGAVDEIAGLLRADDLCRSNVRTAQAAYDQIHDSQPAVETHDHGLSPAEVH